MAPQVTVKPPEAATPVRVVPAQALQDRLDRKREAIARQAYEIFERRGHAHGRDVDDWLEAESELLRRFPRTVAQTNTAFVVFTELPALWNADDLVVGVEPRRLIVSGEREAQVTYSDQSGTRMENRVQSILRVLDLPVDVDPVGTTANLVGKTLEIVMPKTPATGHQAT